MFKTNGATNGLKKMRKRRGLNSGEHDECRASVDLGVAVFGSVGVGLAALKNLRRGPINNLLPTVESATTQPKDTPEKRVEPADTRCCRVAVTWPFTSIVLLIIAKLPYVGAHVVCAVVCMCVCGYVFVRGR